MNGSRDADIAEVALPPYSPELNSAEPPFEEIRCSVEGRGYATFDGKATDVHACLEEFDADPVRVRRTATLEVRDHLE